MEFQVSAKKFRSNKMNAIDQLHVMRKLAPVFTAVGSISSLASLAKSEGALSAIASAVSKVPDEDFNSIIGRCLAVVSVEVAAGVGFAPVWSVQAKRLMFDDIDWVAVIQIVANVIQDNLGNFSTALPSGSNG